MRPQLHKGASTSRRTAAIAALGTLGLWVTAALMSPANVRSFLPALYAAQLALYCVLHFRRGQFSALQTLRPSFVMLCYLASSSALGAAAFSSGAVLQTQWHANYLAWQGTHQLYFLVSASFLLCFLTRAMYRSSFKIVHGLKLVPTKHNSRLFLTLGLLCSALAIALLVETPYQHISIGSVAVAIIYYLFRSGFSFRGSSVVLLMLAIATASAHDKRTAIFTLLPAALMHATFYGRVRIRPRLVLALLATASLVGYLIAAMSIVRGYGGYGDVTLSDAILLVPDYLLSDIALAALSNNFETTYVFYTLHDAVYTSSVAHSAPLEYGQTYLKVFFIGIPDWVFGYRPPSIIDSYTRHSAPVFRADGGSYPPTALGEMFWNFGAHALLVVPVVCSLMDWLYFNLVRTLTTRGFFWSTVALFSYQYVLVFVRGSGLDLYVASILIAIPHVLVLALLISSVAFPLRRTTSSVDSVTPGPW